jgi:hypothetical protein
VRLHSLVMSLMNGVEIIDVMMLLLVASHVQAVIGLDLNFHKVVGAISRGLLGVTKRLPVLKRWSKHSGAHNIHEKSLCFRGLADDCPCV